MRLQLLVSTAAAFLLAVAAPAGAQVIGRAVTGNNSTTYVNGANADGSIDFYALLNGSGTYSNTVGQSADTCTIGAYSSNCGGGLLTMWLRFEPTASGTNLLTLRFTDLDLVGVNDPSYFFESVSIYRGSSSTSLADVDNVNDVPTVVSANVDQQVLRLAVDLASTSPLFTRLVIATRFAANAARGTYVNTEERLLATLSGPVSVPEPATLSMLGAGLLLIGFARRRAARAK
jgi:hypothetical protein